MCFMKRIKMMIIIQCNGCMQVMDLLMNNVHFKTIYTGIILFPVLNFLEVNSQINTTISTTIIV